MKNHFEFAKRVRNAILLRTAECFSYTSWSDEFTSKEIRNDVDWIKSSESFVPIDLSSLSSDQLEDIGFGIWEENNPMRLIPLWILPFLAEPIYTVDISGNERVLNRDDIDNDHRGGLLAYGVIPKE